MLTLVHDDGLTIPPTPREVAAREAAEQRAIRSLLPKQVAANDARIRDLGGKLEAYSARLASFPRDYSHQRAMYEKMVSDTTAALHEAKDRKKALLAVWSERSGAVQPRHHDREG